MTTIVVRKRQRKKETAEVLAFLEANHELEAVMAFMKGKFKPGGKFARKPGAPQRGKPPAPRYGARAAEPPPRSEADLSCINCGKKGHRAKDCRGPPKSREERPCFKCQKTGHIARDCTAPLPVKAITASGRPSAPTSDNPRSYVFAFRMHLMQTDPGSRVGRQRVTDLWPSSCHVPARVRR